MEVNLGVCCGIRGLYVEFRPTHSGGKPWMLMELMGSTSMDREE